MIALTPQGNIALIMHLNFSEIKSLTTTDEKANIDALIFLNWYEVSPPDHE